MKYPYTAIPDSAIPQAINPLYQHLLDTYVSETNKVVSTWRIFSDADLGYKPHPKSTDVGGILKHQLLSERRFFGEFLVTPEPPPDQVLPATLAIETACTRLVELALKRLTFFAQQDTPWWMEVVPFFDVKRQRIWVFWRRVLHTAHHRTQLTLYLRLLGKAVPSTYGPTADVSWEGADPTYTVEAAGRK
ncbi:damage-inducible protein DinB [Alloacidobacterium dinghuense]|uniref:Damage-inducible protein DinB n=1 Tax=Alloacidobacterium dinghuense TaxID=2763107 RepID=A0A7G8BG99_9BACT|nr:DinB family protein [Alloacidobacterium dinghuense]QNI31569.1 damage-inducible protein DinB [Alloacidobacterium dinghuense]